MFYSFCKDPSISSLLRQCQMFYLFISGFSRCINSHHNLIMKTLYRSPKKQGVKSFCLYMGLLRTKTIPRFQSQTLVLEVLKLKTLNQKQPTRFKLICMQWKSATNYNVIFWYKKNLVLFTLKVHIWPFLYLRMLKWNPWTDMLF